LHKLLGTIILLFKKSKKPDDRISNIWSTTSRLRGYGCGDGGAVSGRVRGDRVRDGAEEMSGKIS